jgi:ribosomal protein L39E
VRKNKRVCATALLESAEKERSPKEERPNDRVFVWVSVRASERERARERGTEREGRAAEAEKD